MKYFIYIFICITTRNDISVTVERCQNTKCFSIHRNLTRHYSADSVPTCDIVCAFGIPRVMGAIKSLGCNWWNNMHHIDT